MKSHVSGPFFNSVVVLREKREREENKKKQQLIFKCSSWTFDDESRDYNLSTFSVFAKSKHEKISELIWDSSRAYITFQNSLNPFKCLDEATVNVEKVLFSF